MKQILDQTWRQHFVYCSKTNNARTSTSVWTNDPLRDRTVTVAVFFVTLIVQFLTSCYTCITSSYLWPLRFLLNVDNRSEQQEPEQPSVCLWLPRPSLHDPKARSGPIMHSRHPDLWDLWSGLWRVGELEADMASEQSGKEKEGTACFSHVRFTVCGVLTKIKDAH